MTVERFTLDTTEVLERSVRASCVLTPQSLSGFYAAVRRKDIVGAQAAMADGAIVNGVRIVHPFRPRGLTEAATRLLRPA